MDIDNQTPSDTVMHDLQVLKLGGQEAEYPEFLKRLAKMVAASQTLPVIVHGGGKTINAMLEALHIPTQFQNGQRVTDAKAMEVVEMVLCGVANKRLVRAFHNEGIDAIGLSGMDRGLIKSVPLDPALGRVGSPHYVNVAPIWQLLSTDVLPIIAPVALGYDGLSYNVNADVAAAAVARALQAKQLTFLTNVPGVMIAGAVVKELTPHQVNGAIASGEISGGMIPKVESALAAIAAGVSSVRICNLDTFSGGGTKLVATNKRKQVERSLPANFVAPAKTTEWH